MHLCHARATLDLVTPIAGLLVPQQRLSIRCHGFHAQDLLARVTGAFGERLRLEDAALEVAEAALELRLGLHHAGLSQADPQQRRVEVVRMVAHLGAQQEELAAADHLHRSLRSLGQRTVATAGATAPDPAAHQEGHTIGQRRRIRRVGDVRGRAVRRLAQDAGVVGAGARGAVQAIWRDHVDATQRLLRAHDAHEAVELGRVQAARPAVVHLRPPLAAVVAAEVQPRGLVENGHVHRTSRRFMQGIRGRAGQQRNATRRSLGAQAVLLHQRHEANLLQDAAVRGAGQVARDAQVALGLEEEAVVQQQLGQRLAEIHELVDVALLLGRLDHDVVVQARVAGVARLQRGAAQTPDDLVVLAPMQRLVQQRAALQGHQPQATFAVLQEGLSQQLQHVAPQWRRRQKAFLVDEHQRVEQQTLHLAELLGALRQDAQCQRHAQLELGHGERRDLQVRLQQQREEWLGAEAEPHAGARVAATTAIGSARWRWRWVHEVEERGQQLTGLPGVGGEVGSHGRNGGICLGQTHGFLSGALAGQRLQADQDVGRDIVVLAQQVEARAQDLLLELALIIQLLWLSKRDLVLQLLQLAVGVLLLLVEVVVQVVLVVLLAIILVDGVGAVAQRVAAFHAHRADAVEEQHQIGQRRHLQILRLALGRAEGVHVLLGLLGRRARHQQHVLDVGLANRLRQSVDVHGPLAHALQVQRCVTVPTEQLRHVVRCSAQFEQRDDQQAAREGLDAREEDLAEQRVAVDVERRAVLVSPQRAQDVQELHHVVEDAGDLRIRRVHAPRPRSWPQVSQQAEEDLSQGDHVVEEPLLLRNARPGHEALRRALGQQGVVQAGVDPRHILHAVQTPLGPDADAAAAAADADAAVDAAADADAAFGVGVANLRVKHARHPLLEAEVRNLLRRAVAPNRVSRRIRVVQSQASELVIRQRRHAGSETEGPTTQRCEDHRGHRGVVALASNALRGDTAALRDVPRRLQILEVAHIRLLAALHGLFQDQAVRVHHGALGVEGARLVAQSKLLVPVFVVVAAAIHLRHVHATMGGRPRRSAQVAAVLPAGAALLPRVLEAELGVPVLLLVVLGALVVHVRCVSVHVVLRRRVHEGRREAQCAIHRGLRPGPRRVGVGAPAAPLRPAVVATSQALPVGPMAAGDATAVRARPTAAAPVGLAGLVQGVQVRQAACEHDVVAQADHRQRVHDPRRCVHGHRMLVVHQLLQRLVEAFATALLLVVWESS
eukprot:scaffold300_cov258-Pinguiococcus_pyrenoidosus.AAC.55